MEKSKNTVAIPADTKKTRKQSVAQLAKKVETRKACIQKYRESLNKKKGVRKTTTRKSKKALEDIPI